MNNICEFNAVVIPIFDDWVSLRCLVAELEGLAVVDRIIVVNDNSPQNLGLESLNSSKVTLLNLDRNVGHQMALMIGLRYIVENYQNVSKVVLMDGDGEDRPECVVDLLEAVSGSEGSPQICVSRRGNRQAPIVFKIGYFVYRLLFKAATGQSFDFGNFMAMNRSAALQLNRLETAQIHIGSTVLISGMHLKKITQNRGLRIDGKSRMRLSGLVEHAMRSFAVLSVPIATRVVLGLTAVVTISIILSAATLFLKLLGLATPGWFSVAAGIVVNIGLNAGTFAALFLLLGGRLIFNSKLNNIESYRDFTSIESISPDDSSV